MGNVNFALLGNLLLGSIPAVIVGAMLSARLPQTWLRVALAVMLILIGVKLWWTVFANDPDFPAFFARLIEVFAQSMRVVANQPS